MKAVKCLICCLLTVLILVPFARGQTVRAEGAQYARADGRDVYFCSQKSAEYALFAIPYTYCVEILSSDGDWYYVKYAEDDGFYQALYGYCLKDRLTLIDNPPENIYLNMPVTVTLRTDAPSSSLPVIQDNVTVAYYGSYYSGAEAYSYVLYGNSFGYIYGANENYPLNAVDEEKPETEETNSFAKLITALALTVLAAAALVILYFTTRRKRSA